jgi:dolichyl-diphosphooligosaccharide--protein glycosyltransferase
MASSPDASRKKVSGAWHFFSASLSKLSSRKVMVYSCLALIVSLAVLLRMLPMSFGFTLSEFDPFFHYDVTKYIVEHGLLAWRDWHTDRAWYPYGRDIAVTSYPGLYIAGAAMYFAATALGLKVTVMDVVIVFPVVAAALTCIAIYFLGKEVGGEGVGLLSALFLAVSPAHIDRTSLGFYDDETVGVLGILLTFLLYLKALKRWEGLKTSCLYAAGAGLSLGFVLSSWGAARYPLTLIAVFTFFLIFYRAEELRIVASYGLMLTIGLGAALLVPRLGLGFIKEIQTMVSVGVLILFLLKYVSSRLSRRARGVFLVASAVVLGMVTALLLHTGIISLPGAKFLSVLNPYTRLEMPLLESVSEHRPSTWSSFYYQFGQLVFLAPLGILFALRRTTYPRLFMAIYAVTTLYFSSSMARLAIIVSPAFAILGALAIVEIIQPFSRAIAERTPARRRVRLSPRLSRGFRIFAVAALFILTIRPMMRCIDAAYSPTTIVASSLPVRIQVGDWMEALQWMRDNLPPDVVVASWWDYGYWLQIVAGKISLADNGTINGTQIAQIGRMFMSTEEEALKILKGFDADYIVVFTTINQAQYGQLLFGDEVKWRWMAQIGWNSTADKPLEDTSVTSSLAMFWEQMTQDQNLLRWYNNFAGYALPKSDRLLTKLIIHGSFPGLFSDLTPQNFELVFASSRRFVLVYKINYPAQDGQ